MCIKQTADLFTTVRVIFLSDIIQCRLRILLRHSGHNYDTFDGIMQMNLTRDKVEIVIHFTTPFRGRGV